MCVWKILEASVTLADEAGFVEVLPNVVPHLLGGGTVIIYDQFVIIVINGNLFGLIYLEVVGKEQTRMLLAFVFNILRPVTSLGNIFGQKISNIKVSSVQQLFQKFDCSR